MQSHTFTDFSLSGPILAAIQREGYTIPTEIQSRSIPPLLEGRDILGTAQTGTGKTAAFVLPLLDRLMKERPVKPAGGSPREAGHRTGKASWHHRGGAAQPRALILAPTRELAIQIDESIHRYGSGSGITHSVVFGGAPKPTQAARLRSRPQILTATPGRLMDFIGDGVLNLSAVEILILDEADRMLDMGFIPTVRQIAAMAEDRNQTVLFSATMPKEIETLARELLQNPERIAVAPQEVTVDRITQSVLHVDQADKITLLPELIRDRGMFRVIVFTRTKHRASRVARVLSKQNIPSDAIHGDRSQNQRQRALESFRRGKIQVLVATDVAARGIDVDDITHVINFEIPNEAESYVHRIGRTARAGSAGAAIALCDTGELDDLRAIEKLLGTAIPVDRDHAYHREPVIPMRRPGNPGARQGRNGGGNGGGYGGAGGGGGARRSGGAPRGGGARGGAPRGDSSRGRRPGARHAPGSPRDGASRGGAVPPHRRSA